jgi:chorismate-pyruvate lyase
MNYRSRGPCASFVVLALCVAALFVGRPSLGAGDPGADAAALLKALNAELLAHDSASATLQRWCVDHRLAPAPAIVAIPLHTAPVPASAEQRGLLQVGAGEPLRFRHVQLRCGSVVLSEAENWYVPARLTAAMNHELDTTEQPFGLVVRALDFHRRRLEARMLWSPPAPLPEAVLEHRALLLLPDGTPFSLVDETYMRSVLGAAAAP